MHGFFIGICVKCSHPLLFSRKGAGGEVNEARVLFPVLPMKRTDANSALKARQIRLFCLI